jgi:hypothetical protein
MSDPALFAIVIKNNDVIGCLGLHFHGDSSEILSKSAAVGRRQCPVVGSSVLRGRSGGQRESHRDEYIPLRISYLFFLVTCNANLSGKGDYTGRTGRKVIDSLLYSR